MRWLIAIWLTLSTILNVIEKQTLSIVAPFLRETLHISVAQYSYVVTAFLLSYGVMYAVGGWFVDRVGERIGMAACVGWWAVCTMLTSLVQGVFSLGAVRFLVGLGEPGVYPAALKTTTRWFPKAERGTPIALFSSGGAVGNMLAAPLIAVVALRFGWRATFLLPGMLGLFWLAGWLTMYRLPEKHPGIAAKDLAELAEEDTTDPKLGYLALFRNRNVLALVLARLISDPVNYFYIFFIPEYLKSQRGFSLADIGMYAWIPFVAGAIGGMVGGRWSDILIKRGTQPAKARLRILYASAAVAPLGILTSQVHSAALALVLMSLMSFIVYCWFINTAALIPDIAPVRQTGSILGIIGTAGTFGGMLFMPLVGFLVTRFGSYQLIFAIVGSVHVIAALTLRGVIRIPKDTPKVPKDTPKVLEECYEA
jgi:ACS family hexuronate transporter-like MFS transporter